jgi:hypothetical protein
VASAAPAPQPTNPPSDGGFFSNLARKVGLSSADTATSAPPPAPAKPKVVEARRSETTPRPEASIPKAAKPETKQAAARPPLKPTVADQQTAAAPPPPAKDSLVAGSQPIVQANSFESRFGAMK